MGGKGRAKGRKEREREAGVTVVEAKKPKIPSKTSARAAPKYLRIDVLAVLANERTFLAWLRTSLSLITVGVGMGVLLFCQQKETKREY